MTTILHGSTCYPTCTPTCFARPRPWLPLPTLYPSSRGLCLLSCWRSSTLVAQPSTSSSSPWLPVGAAWCPPLPPLHFPLAWLIPGLGGLQMSRPCTVALSRQLPLWQWTLLPPPCNPPPLMVLRPYLGRTRPFLHRAAWKALTGFDHRKETPPLFLGPLLPGHALKSMALHPLPVLPSVAATRLEVGFRAGASCL